MLGWGQRARKDSAAPSHALYERIVGQARQPEFYARYGVPDTPLGRFEMIALHAFLVMRRLKRCGRDGAETAQALFDLMFADVDRNLREMGVGDLGVGRRVKALAKGFYGCVQAYEAALDGGGESLDAALARNLYAGAPPDADLLASVADYVRREDAALGRTNAEGLLAGRVQFGAPP